MTFLSEHQHRGMDIDGREVKINSLRIGGLNARDYPRFPDAYFESGEYEDGTPLSERELNYLTDNFYWMLNELSLDQFMDQGDRDIHEMRQLAGLPALQTSTPEELEEARNDTWGRKFNKAMSWSPHDRGESTPAGILQRVRSYTDQELQSLIDNRTPGSGSARSLQIRAAERELKRRYGLTPKGNIRESETVTKQAVGGDQDAAHAMKRELSKIRDYAQELSDMLDQFPDGVFPYWWQSKLTKASDYMSTIKHYLEGEMELDTQSAQSEIVPVPADSYDEFEDDIPQITGFDRLG